MYPLTLSINGQAINVLVSEGEGPAVLLIHGNSSSAHTFIQQLDSPLGQHYRLVAMDLPGHGASENASDPQHSYNLPGYAEIATAVVEQLKLERPLLVGWSLGGHIVLEMVRFIPDAAGLMIYGAPPLGWPPAMADSFLPHPAMAAAFQETLNDAEATAFVQAFFHPDAPPAPQSFLADVQRTDGRARSGLAASIAPDGYTDEVQIVAQLNCPLAIVQGEQEQLVNLAYLAGLNAPTLWRNAVQIISNAGHAPHWEQPEQFNTLLTEFIAACA